ncbi:MAG: WecB/TagA/CpsF family glycosyltransferase [bacterium]|nr:WecB/TagA/CpsF family glycosyltransferase [bacterium]
MTTETVELFNIRFDNVTFEEVRGRIAERIESREPSYVVTPNVDHVCRYAKDEHFRTAYGGAYLVLADGMPLLWASRLLGKPLYEKLSGSDLVPLLCEFAAQRGYTVFFFGAEQGVAEEAMHRLCKRYPALQVAGAYSPPYGFDECPEENAKAVAKIAQARPDICFVALGCPRQEYWMERHFREADASVMLGVGAALDFAAGKQKRAPVWVQNWGMEWLWRLCHEPRRLWRRYLVEDSYFLSVLWREWRKGRRA